MIKKQSPIILEESKTNFLNINAKNELNIQFNRIAFIFFIFLMISLIYSIHLLHLGSRKLNLNTISPNLTLSKKLNRADIVDRNGNIIVKTVNSIDIGINPIDVIDKKKLLINLRYIFPEKDFESIKKKLDDKKFFWLEKKYQKKIMKKL